MTVRSFVGLVNYYKDMWPRRAHILAPLTNLCSSKAKFQWNETHESAVQQMKRLVTDDVLLRFPNHGVPFEIFTNASQVQIGASIKQHNLPVAYFSKKLSPTQRRYSTIEQEMLAIVEVLKEYRNFLLGAEITIYTDHKNLLATSTINDRVFRWKQKIQEYNPTIKYNKGHINKETDALSCLPMMATQEGMETTLNHPPVDLFNPILNSNPVELTCVQSHQQRDSALMRALEEDYHFSFLKLHKRSLITYSVPGSSKRAIDIPQTLQYPTIRWLHSILGHAGKTRLLANISSHFWFPKMGQFIIEHVRKRKYCQRCNKQTQKYDHLPPKNIDHLKPWDEVRVDLIGPWKVVINQFEYYFRALACIYPIINLPEIIPINTATSREVADAFEDQWLGRYPFPQRCIHDNGNEFLGW